MTDRPPESAYTDQEQFDQAQQRHWDKVEVEDNIEGPCYICGWMHKGENCTATKE